MLQNTHVFDACCPAWWPSDLPAYRMFRKLLTHPCTVVPTYSRHAATYGSLFVGARVPCIPAERCGLDSFDWSAAVPGLAVLSWAGHMRGCSHSFMLCGMPKPEGATPGRRCMTLACSGMPSMQCCCNCVDNKSVRLECSVLCYACYEGILQGQALLS